MTGDRTAEDCLLVAGEPEAHVNPLFYRYAPRIVMRAEDTTRDRPPWPSRTHDYHPRTVELFLEGCRSTEIKPPNLGDPDTERHLATLSPERQEIVRGMFATGFFSPSTPDRLTRFTAYVGHITEQGSGRPLAYFFVALTVLAALTGVDAQTVLLGGLLSGVLFLISRPSPPPATGMNVLRERLAATWPMTLSREAMTAVGRVDGASAWARYRTAVQGDGDARYPRTIYCRLKAAGHLVAVQYWLFFFYNHWRNIHEADWELITVFHDPALDRAEFVGLSSHEDGLRRSRSSVTWVDEQPVVYCAVGSHALYFRPEPNGYLPSVDLARYIGGPPRRASAGSSRDWVPDVDPDETSALPRFPYRFVELPEDPPDGPHAPGWNEWWWLAYGGGWGRVTPIHGPANQGVKWSDPVAWSKLLVSDDKSSTRQA